MRKTRITALLLCALMIVPNAGCGSKSSKKSTTSKANAQIVGDEPGEPVRNAYQQDANIGKNEVVADIKEEAEANDTGFTLNRVIAYKDPERSEKYIYFDVNIKNDTSDTYDLSVLNNFYLIYPDGNEKYSDIKTELYANSKFQNYYMSPFNIPANGEFKGIVGGFAVDPSLDEFTIGFFPTRVDNRNKESVIKIKVTPDLIVDNPSDILK